MNADYLKGARAMVPIMLGVIPMAMVTGVAAVSCGMTSPEALVSSFMLYAAASQLVAYKMLETGADPVLIFAAAVVLNLRFLLYSAGMAPYMRQARLGARLLGAYALSDQAYGITMVRRRREPGSGCTEFYIGAALFMYVIYQIAAAAGVFLGAAIPAEFSLDFAVPLTFSALLVPLLGEPGLRTAAAVSAGTALFLADLPGNAGFFVATFAGIASGLIHSRRRAGGISHDA